MSYFIVISGENALSVQAAVGLLVPIREAQSYIAHLAQEIAALDGRPSFLWEDAKTGTSHEVVSAAEQCLFEEQPIETSALGQLINSCALHHVAARVWWASNEPSAFAKVSETNNVKDTIALIHKQAGKVAGIGFVLHPN